MTLGPDGTTRFIKWFQASPQLKDLRGGSAGIATKNGYLFVVHRRYHLADKLRFTHQFLELDHQLQPQRLSKEFSFFSTGLIEYCAGLAQRNDRYLLTFGLNDSLPFLLQINVDCVEKLLQPLPESIVENKTIMGCSLNEQYTEASVDFPKDFELGRVRLAKLRIKELLNRTRGGHLRA